MGCCPGEKQSVEYLVWDNIVIPLLASIVTSASYDITGMRTFDLMYTYSVLAGNARLHIIPQVSWDSGTTWATVFGVDRNVNVSTIIPAHLIDNNLLGGLIATTSMFNGYPISGDLLRFQVYGVNVTGASLLSVRIRLHSQVRNYIAVDD